LEAVGSIILQINQCGWTAIIDRSFAYDK